MHDRDGQRFLDEIAVVLFQNYPDVDLATAVSKVKTWADTAWSGGITGDHVIYHECPEYWANAVYHGRRDFWKTKV